MSYSESIVLAHELPQYLSVDVDNNREQRNTKLDTSDDVENCRDANSAEPSGEKVARSKPEEVA